MRSWAPAPGKGPGTCCPPLGRCRRPEPTGRERRVAGPPTTATPSSTSDDPPEWAANVRHRQAAGQADRQQQCIDGHRDGGHRQRHRTSTGGEAAGQGAGSPREGVRGSCPAPRGPRPGGGGPACPLGSSRHASDLLADHCTGRVRSRGFQPSRSDDWSGREREVASRCARPCRDAMFPAEQIPALTSHLVPDQSR